MTRAQRLRAGALALALSLSGLAGCGEDGETNVGRVFFTWSLESEVDGAPLACAPAEVVQITIGNTQETFDCALGAATTAFLVEGTYVATFDLLDAGFLQSAVTLEVPVSGGDVTDMGHILFTVAE